MRLKLPTPVSEIVAVVCAVAAGAILLTFCLVLAESGLRSTTSPDHLTGTDVVLAGDQKVRQDEDIDLTLPVHSGVPADLVAEVSSVDGVGRAAGVLRFPAAISDGAGGYLAEEDVAREGHNWAPLAGTDDLRGQPPHQDTGVVLAEGSASAAGVGIGDEIEIALNGQPVTMTVSGVLEEAESGVFLSDAHARNTTSRAEETVDSIAVQAADGVNLDSLADRIAQLPGSAGLVVHTGTAIGEAEQPAAGAARGLLLAIAVSMGGIVVMLVGFITAGTVSIAVTNRARELALLRAVGATPRQVRSLVAAGATRVGLVSVGPGVAAGYLLAWAVQDPLTASGLLAAGQRLSWSPLPGLASAVLLLGVVQIAGRVAALPVSRMSPTAAVTSTDVEPATAGWVRTRIGTVLLLLSLGSATVPLITRSEAALISATAGTLLTIIGLSLVAPAVVRRIGGLVGARIRSAPSWLAVHNTGAYALRTGGAISVLALAIGLILTQIYTGSTLETVHEEEAGAGTLAQAAISAPGAGGVSQQTVTDLAAAPEVGAAVPVIRTQAMHPDTDSDRAGADEHAMLAVGPDLESVLDLDVVDGDLGALHGQSVALDANTAWLAGVSVGDDFPLLLADGTRVDPEVVATYSRGFGFGKVVAAVDLVAEAGAGLPLYDTVLLTGDGSHADELGGSLTAIAAGVPGLQVERPPLSVTGGSGPDMERMLNLGFTLVLMGYVLLAVGNRLVATTLRRRREWQVLRSIGMTAAQLRSMATRETALICLGATIAGVTLSLVPMTMAAIGFLGRPWPQGPFWAVVVVALAATVVAQAATLVPTRHLLRLKVSAPEAG